MSASTGKYFFDISYTLKDSFLFFLSVIFSELVAAAAIGIFLASRKIFQDPESLLESCNMPLFIYKNIFKYITMVNVHCTMYGWYVCLLSIYNVLCSNVH